MSHNHKITFNHSINLPLAIKTHVVNSKLIINGVMEISSEMKPPSKWGRFWYKILLGWVWEDLRPKKKNTQVHLLPGSTTSLQGRFSNIIFPPASPVNPSLTVLDFVFKSIDKNGMIKFLDDFGSLLLDATHLIPAIKEKYPQDENKVKLWEKLHGV